MKNTYISTIEYAKVYLSLGWSIIPVKNKVPVIPSWKEYQERLPTEDELTLWFGNDDTNGIALVTGSLSGIGVVDDDYKDGKSEHGFYSTVRVKTGGGGYHLYYKFQEGLGNQVRVGDVPIDIRTEGGYVVLPPTVHASGNQYIWEYDAPSLKDALETLPNFPVQFINNLQSKSTKNPNKRINVAECIKVVEGKRNDTLYRLGCMMINDNSPEHTSEMLSVINQTYKPPLSDEELQSIIKQVMVYSQPWKTDKQPSAQQPITPITFDQLCSHISTWLLLEDTDVLKLLAATIISNRLDGDPVWIFLIAPPGGCKTELIMGLTDIPGTYYISDLTEHTLLSGDQGKPNQPNPSLLLRLPPEPILLYKDFTTVLSMHPDKKDAILAQLREIYDGSIRKEFGNGITREWTGKLAFIAGCTPIIDKHKAIYSALGERFLQYRIPQTEPIELSLRAQKNTGSEKPMRKEIRECFRNYIGGITLPKEPIQLPGWLSTRIAHLSTFCVRARSAVITVGYNQTIDFVPEPEVPTRFSKQLATLAKALMLMDREFTDTQYRLLLKLGLDSLPKKRRELLETLMRVNGKLTTSEISQETGYPRMTVERALDELVALNLVSVTRHGQGTPTEWELTEETRKRVLHGMIYESKGPSEEQPEEDDPLLAIRSLCAPIEQE